MLRKATSILDLEVYSKENQIVGVINDLLFDDATWTIRYFALSGGSFRLGRIVLLTPDSFVSFEENSDGLKTSLSFQQIENCPPIEEHMPISRHYENQLHGHFGWFPYWQAPIYPWVGTYTYPPLWGQNGVQRDIGENIVESEHVEPHLRSFSEVQKYRMHAEDGLIGELEDLMVDIPSWRVTHLIADTRRWIPGKQVVLDKGLVQDFRWAEKEVLIEMSQDEIKSAPEFDPDRLPSETFQRQIADYYRDVYSRHHPHG